MRNAIIITSVLLGLVACTHSPQKEDPLSFIQEPPSYVNVDETTELALAGNSKAQYLLGLLYLKGKEIEKNKEEAITWLTKAATNGELEASVILGVIYFHGIGIEKNTALAKDFFARPAHLNHAVSQRYIGKIFASGEGVQQDYQKAYMWLFLAKLNDDVEAEAALSELSKEMTSTEIQLASDVALNKLSEINLNIDEVTISNESAADERKKTETKAENIPSVKKPATPSPPIQAPALPQEPMPSDEINEPSCTQFGPHAYYSFSNEGCFCETGYYASNNYCIRIPNCVANSTFNFSVEECECDYGYEAKDGYCYKIKECPSNSTFDIESDTCYCNYGYVSENGICINEILACGFGGTYNRQNGTCDCIYGYYEKNGKCELEPYCFGGSFDVSTGGCICDSDYYPKDGKCKYKQYCGEGGYFSVDDERCICYAGYSAVGSYCMKDYNYQ